MTTLKVPGSLLRDVTVCSSRVEKECDRTWASGRAPVDSGGGCCVVVEASSGPTEGSGGGGVGSERGVLAPYRLCSHSLLVGRRYVSWVALSGGVCGGKTKGSGWGRERWLPGRLTGLHGVSVLLKISSHVVWENKNRRWVAPSSFISPQLSSPHVPKQDQIAEITHLR